MSVEGYSGPQRAGVREELKKGRKGEIIRKGTSFQRIAVKGDGRRRGQILIAGGEVAKDGVAHGGAGALDAVEEGSSVVQARGGRGWMKLLELVDGIPAAAKEVERRSGRE